jgi:gluconolactonase
MSNSPIPIKEFRLDLSELTYTGHDLVRPESMPQKSICTLLKP